MTKYLFGTSDANDALTFIPKHQITEITQQFFQSASNNLWKEDGIDSQFTSKRAH